MSVGKLGHQSARIQGSLHQSMVMRTMKSSKKCSRTMAAPVRFAFTSLGLLFLALGIIGIYLPGIPTTGPVILASILLGRGNPHLRQRLLASPTLRPYTQFIDGRKRLTWKIRCWALFAMWTTIAVSCCVISLSAASSQSAMLACCIGGLAGTICIVLYRAPGNPSFDF